MSIFTQLRRHLVVSVLVVLAAIIIAIIAGRAATRKSPAENNGGMKQVTLVNAATLRQGSLTVSANGIVESHSQADLRSQISAPVSIINVSIGETVYTGQTILELHNADTRAQLAQVQASLALAQGQYSTGAISLESTKQATVDKIRDAYIKTYDAVITQAEPVLYNNDGNGGRLSAYSTDNALYSEMISSSIDLRTGLNDWKTLNSKLSSDSSTIEIIAVAKIAHKNIRTASILLSDMSKILNDISTYATPSFLTSVNIWKGVVTGAQSAISGAEQALTASEMALSTTNNSQGATANAQIALAQAGVNNLEAQLAKTIIRSPITGKVSSLPLRVGELASPGTLLATVIGNDSGLEVKAYVSGEDLYKVQVGASVTIKNPAGAHSTSTESTLRGVVANIAPSVDVTTKKAEVVINIIDATRSGLVIGNNVTVYISSPNSTVVGSERNVYLLPIQNVKIVPGATYVFTVDADSKVKRNDVTIGKVNGDFIEVTNGLADDMNIISSVYELDEGQVVKVQ